MSTRWTATEYCELRDLVLSRVTLFNARSGSKPARLTLKEQHNAHDYGWHDRNNTDHCNDTIYLLRRKKMQNVYNFG